MASDCRDRRRRIPIVHDDGHAHRNYLVERLRREHRYPNAAVACRPGRHRRMPVNRGSVHEIDGIVEFTQRAFLPAGELLADPITSWMCDGVARPALRFELLPAA